MTNPFVGGIEAGGTKFVCAVGTGPEDIRAESRFPTTTPEETIGRVLAFFREQIEQLGPLAAVGIGSFGPIDPNPASSSFGFITTTPKPGWGNTNLGGAIGDGLQVPIGFDTDVNVAGLGEWRWGAAQGIDNFIYITIGTGVGGGGLNNGKLMRGLIHPEMGHIYVPHDRLIDPFVGHCPYHGDCFEGMASGPAMAARWGSPAQLLPPEHPAWELEAHYIAMALHTLICTLSPERVILGGGVMQQAQLYPLIRQKVLTSLSGYVQSPVILDGIDDYIVPPALGGRAGVLGAIALGQMTAV